mgnify:CR=1 FL=1
MYDIEPCTITADVVAQFLEDQHRPRMASFVRDVGKQLKLAWEMANDSRTSAASLRERLMKYEPELRPAPAPGYCRRSEWE